MLADEHGVEENAQLTAVVDTAKRLNLQRLAGGQQRSAVAAWELAKGNPHYIHHIQPQCVRSTEETAALDFVTTNPQWGQKRGIRGRPKIVDRQRDANSNAPYFVLKYTEWVDTSSSDYVRILLTLTRTHAHTSLSGNSRVL